MLKKTLYLECYSGISGDMTVASLIDLGADVEILTAGLNSLNVDGYKIEISRKAINSIDTCDFHVILDVPETNYMVDDNKNTLSGVPFETHSHDYYHKHNLEHSHYHNLEHLKEHTADHSHIHNSEHTHEQNSEHIIEHKADNLREHSTGYKHVNLHASLKQTQSKHIHSHSNEGDHPHIHYGHHEHRNLNDINTIIDGSGISDNAKQIAKKIFYIVAAAESKAHGKPIEEVHFHEVGAVDSIVDIVAVSICLDNLNIGEVIVSELYEGTGHINCQHGVLPVPVPAVVNIVTEHHLPLHITSINGELVTPTGAAIAAAIRTKEVLPKEFKIMKVGLGAGKRNYERTSFLRAMLIETSTNSSSAVPDKVCVLEANIDDCSGEAMSIAMETLLQNGAKDVYYTPIFMKKNRPAYLLGVISSEDKVEKMEEIIFTHTTTIGIRRKEALRSTLNREIKSVTTPYGEALVKVCTYQDKTFYYPECDSIKKLCNKSGEDYITLYSLVQTLASQF